MTMAKTIRVGCGAGFWGDSPDGPRQLVRSGRIDYLVLDYLAEITMSILARMKAKTPTLGYATDFVTHVMAPLAREIAEKKIRVVTNAGGVNPLACRDALLKAFAEAGVDLKVAVVLGDDLSGQSNAFRANGVREMFSGADFPKATASINAYLGAFPIAAALAAGADVVITGRCVDSAIALGPLIHEFGWRAEDHDLLSAGSLVGHVLECGAQATGGIVTDWRGAAPFWSDMGFPVAECSADGAFELGLADGCHGLVTRDSVTEQIVYEVGDPARYMLPDVCCDWTHVKVEEAGANRVRVSGARGCAPSTSYKVSATYLDGYRASATMMIVGREAAERARRVGEAILARTSRLIGEAGLAPFSETSVEVLGAEESYGAQARRGDSREVILKIAARHVSREALDLFGREIYPAATAMAQSLTGFAGGRPQAQPVVRLFSFLVDKSAAPVSIVLPDGATMDCAIARGVGAPAPPAHAAPHDEAAPEGASAQVPLVALAHGRSGDKGDIANIGVLARDPCFAPLLRRQLTAEAVQKWFEHHVRGKVERFEWPGLDGFNFVMHEALGGGGVASLRHDPQGKAMAQVLMDFPIDVPADWLAPGGKLHAFAEGQAS